MGRGACLAAQINLSAKKIKVNDHRALLPTADLWRNEKRQEGPRHRMVTPVAVSPGMKRNRRISTPDVVPFAVEDRKILGEPIQIGRRNREVAIKIGGSGSVKSPRAVNWFFVPPSTTQA